LEYGTKREHGTISAGLALTLHPADGKDFDMLTFAISLLFTAGAAFALLVIVAMLAGNRHAILSALRGQGAFPGMAAGAGGTSPQRAQVRVGELRRGRRAPQPRPFAATLLRAAA
jgi:hypothetical protein